MKTLRYIGLILLTMAFATCKDDTEPQYTTGTQPTSGQMTSPAAGKSYVLTTDKDNDVMDTYQWSATNFGIPVGTRYTLLLDKADGDFSNAYMLVTSTTATTAAFTVKQINDAMMALKCFEETPTNMKMRISTTAMGGESSTMVLSGFPTANSSDFSLVITPYKGEIPVKAPLFIVGGVFPNGWDNPKTDGVGTKTQPFFSDNNILGNTQYTYTGYFEKEGMKYVTAPGSWHPQYGMISAGKLGYCNNCPYEEEPAPVPIPSAGYYRIDVDINMEVLSYSITPVTAPSRVYNSVTLTGDAVSGDVAMTKLDFNEHMWTIPTVFLSISPNGLKFNADNGDVYGSPKGSDDNFPFGKGANNDDDYIKPLNEGNYCVMFNDITGEYTFVNLDKFN